MMKIIITYICLLLSNTSYSGEPPKDPFSDSGVKPVDKTKDLGSENFLSEGLLAAFKEKRLEKGIGNTKSLIRITIIRSLHSPLMFQWFPGESRLQVKRLNNDSDPFGDSYGELSMNRAVKLTAIQNNLLKSLYSKAPLDILPQAYWQPQGLDGSTWVYESAVARKGTILVARRSPIDPSKASLEYTNIKSDRLAKELQLTSFALMLWMLSGVDEDPY